MEADYEKYILDFARLAQSEKWNCFVLGRNLNAIAKRPQYWSHCENQKYIPEN
jgi:hypothetical protein